MVNQLIACRNIKTIIKIPNILDTIQNIGDFISIDIDALRAK